LDASPYTMPIVTDPHWPAGPVPVPWSQPGVREAPAAT
jgi:hypothetical protein